MTRIWVLFIFLFSFSVGAADMTLTFSETKIKQGSLIDTVISLDGNSLQQLEVQKLKGQTFADTIFFYSLSPLVRKNGGDFTADAKIIFAKVPESKTISGKIGTTDLTVHFPQVEFVATEAPPTYLFGTFEIPHKIKIFGWIVGLIALGILILLGMNLRKRWLQKVAAKKRRIELKAELSNVKQFDEAVDMWKKKHIFMSEFPHIEDPFKEFEKVLFKYQFKQRQSEYEKNEVMNAYQQFLNQIQGGFNGI